MPNKLSIDYDDDDLDLLGFCEYTNNIVERDKRVFSNKIIEAGEDIIKDIDNKNSLRNKNKLARIKYILKNSKNYTKEYLMQIDFNDVRDIYLEIKGNRKSLHLKIFDFLFGHNIQ